jgi:hypothetical protein
MLPVNIVPLFPPHQEPVMPRLALPSLAAHLRLNGVEVTLDDLNAEVFDRRLSRRHLCTVAGRLVSPTGKCAAPPRSG